MKNLILAFLLLASFSAGASFEDYFLDKSLRLDYFHSGNAADEYYSFDEMIEEPFWGGSKVNLTDRFDYGNYKFEVYDLASNTLVYSYHYSTLFAEWRTTAEAKTTSRTFEESAIFPFPKGKVRVDFYSRDKRNEWHKKWEYLVDPSSYFISREKMQPCRSDKVHYSGDPAQKLDIVIIAEGYTKKEMRKFRKDAARFAGYILDCAPYSAHRDMVNIWGVESVSLEEGTDIPGKGVWVNTAAGSTYYTFGTERYLTSAHNKRLRNIAANVPYDQIFVLVNTKRYGGGGVYNCFSVCSADDKNSAFVAIHEFGHAFAGLGDEYYTSDVAVEDFYPAGTEPWEPNLTTLTAFDKKWKNMLAPGTPVPTPDAAPYKDKLGVFEGGGYVEKGVYRPMIDCSMKSLKYDHFCPVCKKAIEDMLEFYCR